MFTSVTVNEQNLQMGLSDIMKERKVVPFRTTFTNSDGHEVEIHGEGEYIVHGLKVRFRS
jgi:hypothetical protein